MEPFHSGDYLGSSEGGFGRAGREGRRGKGGVFERYPYNAPMGKTRPLSEMLSQTEQCLPSMSRDGYRNRWK